MRGQRRDGRDGAGGGEARGGATRCQKRNRTARGGPTRSVSGGRRARGGARANALGEARSRRRRARRASRAGDRTPRPRVRERRRFPPTKKSRRPRGARGSGGGGGFARDATRLDRDGEGERRGRRGILGRVPVDPRVRGGLLLFGHRESRRAPMGVARETLHVPPMTESKRRGTKQKETGVRARRRRRRSKTTVCVGSPSRQSSIPRRNPANQ